MKTSIYLDYAATTPVSQAVAKAMQACLTFDGVFGNAASNAHVYGWQASEKVEEAREQIAQLIGADVREIVFSSGATESNNLALFGAARFARKADSQKDHIITTTIEHKAVLDVCAQLENEGFQVSYIQPDASGRVCADAISAAITERTLLVSVMHANNETGAINPIQAIAKHCREHGVLLHVDAAQTVGKLAIDVKAMQIDMLSICAHKFYGPKGSGALYVSRQPKVDIDAIIYGGGHERGMRSGTLATHQIVGLGEACVQASQNMQEEQLRLGALRDQLWQGIKDLPNVRCNSPIEIDGACLQGHLNVCFSGVEGETLLMSLRRLAVSSGSACNSASMKPSYVLTQMGLSDRDADSSIRFSLGAYTQEGDIELAIAHIREVYSRLAAA